MFFGIVISVSVIGAIVLAIGLFLQRGREGVDLSPRPLLSAYLYVASLAAVIVTAGGLAALLTFGLGTAAARETIYGGSFGEVSPVKCAPGIDCSAEATPQEQRRRVVEQRDRRAGEDLIRGISFTLLGLLFFIAHWTARRALKIDEGRSALRRGYLMLGTLAFGLATFAMLPDGVTTVASNALLAATPDTYRPRAGEPLAGGLVALVIWLAYLRLVVRDFRNTSA
ncbi:MAG: hypothetical protein EXR61_02590 [Chloroflexi bacterium]|nr:hypothetical protein [Chloroflexota bacterium]